MNTPQSNLAANWSHHWSQTETGSIDLQGADPVATALREFWIDQSEWLMRCSRVADVGSGNAILLRLFSASLPEQIRSEWICQDRAVLPTNLSHEFGAMITVMDGRPFEHTEPTLGKVDAIVSNFGIEYSDTQAAARNCANWLSPGGRLRLVVHATGSVIDKASAVSIGDLKAASHETGLFERARDLLNAIATLPSDHLARMAHGVQQRDAYNAAVATLKRRMDDRSQASAALVNLLQSIQALASHAMAGDVQGAIQQLTELQAASERERFRLMDMGQSAMSAVQVSAFVNDLSNAGLPDIKAAAIECELGLVAWVVFAG